MKLVILDSGLIDSVGHHFGFDYLITKECCRMGLDYALYGNRDIVPYVSTLLQTFPWSSMTPYVDSGDALDQKSPWGSAG